jgi:hypothetical protein
MNHCNIYVTKTLLLGNVGNITNKYFAIKFVGRNVYPKTQQFFCYYHSAQDQIFPASLALFQIAEENYLKIYIFLEALPLIQFRSPVLTGASDALKLGIRVAALVVLHRFSSELK